MFDAYDFRFEGDNYIQDDDGNGGDDYEDNDNDNHLFKL